MMYICLILATPKILKEKKYFTSFDYGSQLSHRKLGYASMHLISKFSKKNLIIGLPKLNFEKDYLCKAYSIEKQIRASF